MRVSLFFYAEWVSEWVNISLRYFLPIVAIWQQKEARIQDDSLLLPNDFKGYL